MDSHTFTAFGPSDAAQLLAYYWSVTLDGACVLHDRIWAYEAVQRYAAYLLRTN